MKRDRDEKLLPGPKRPPLDGDAPHLDKSKHAPDGSARPKDKQPGDSMGKEKPDTSAGKERAKKEANDAAQRAVDEASDESFPASDPPAFTGSRIGGPRKKVPPK